MCVCSTVVSPLHYQHNVAPQTVKSCAVLGLRECDVAIVEDERLPDGMETDWPAEVVAEHITKHLAKEEEAATDAIFTFDAGGVSGHANHVACYRGAVHWAVSRTTPLSANVSVFVLESTNLLRKYSGLLDAPLSMALSERCHFHFDPLFTYRAMSAHWSQFVWYRKLFVVFSRYAYMNTLRQLTPQNGFR